MVVNKKSENSFLCIIHMGCIKLGFVKYVVFNSSCNINDELEKFKNIYGHVKALYVMINDSEASILKKIHDYLDKKSIKPYYGDIYELNITKATKEVKSIFNVTDLILWDNKIKLDPIEIDEINEIDEDNSLNESWGNTDSEPEPVPEPAPIKKTVIRKVVVKSKS